MTEQKFSALSNDIASRFRVVQDSVRLAALDCGRNPDDIHVIAVSKMQPVETIHAALDAGITLLGENYAQELKEKAAAIDDDEHGTARPVWHFIGHLQTNKVKMILPAVSCIHSVDSERLAAEISKLAAREGRTIDVLLQVNTSGEESKSGCEPHEIFALADAALKLPNLHVRGLMTIAAFADDPEIVRPMFKQLRSLRDELRTRFAGFSYFGAAPDFHELSMGMSNDYRVAIQEGATMVRVGTAIFGAREYNL